MKLRKDKCPAQQREALKAADLLSGLVHNHKDRKYHKWDVVFLAQSLVGNYNLSEKQMQK